MTASYSVTTKPGQRTKEEVVAAIAALLGVPPPPIAHGSREPKEILVLVNERLGLGFSSTWAKPDLAAAICQAAGVPWTPSCHSRPMTLTRVGLERVERAVQVLLTPL